MGYRLNIKAKGEDYYGTKIFGYFDENELRSYWVLRAFWKITEDTTWYGYDENRITLGDCEFNIFFDAYISDLEYSDKLGLEFDIEETLDELRKFKEIKGDKEIWWD